MRLKLETVNPTPAHRAGPEPWLDDDQQQAWRHVVGLFMTLPSAIDSDLQRNAGLSLYEYLVLANLSETPDGMLQMSDLAQRANSSLSRLSHLISRLEKRGWVIKRPCENDRRASSIVLTAAGKKEDPGRSSRSRAPRAGTGRSAVEPGAAPAAGRGCRRGRASHRHNHPHPEAIRRAVARADRRLPNLTRVTSSRPQRHKLQTLQGRRAHCRNYLSVAGA